MLSLVWRASALDDLATIIDYIAERNVPASERLEDAIEAASSGWQISHIFTVPVECLERARRWSIPIIFSSIA